MFNRSYWLPFLLLFAGQLVGQSTAESRFSGSIRAGYRQVDVDTSGLQSKFRQHYLLESGPRIFDLAVRLAPIGLAGRLIDSIELEGRNLGGDPFESFKIGLRKRGIYDLKYDRRKSTYYYNDLIRPENVGSQAARNIGDLNMWNFDRVMESAALKVWLGSRMQLHLIYAGNMRSGTGEAAIDIDGATERPNRTVDDQSVNLTAALELRLDRITLVIEEKRYSYDQAGRLTTPTEWLEFDDSSAYALLSPTHASGIAHSIRFVAQPSSRIVLKAAVNLDMLDQTFDFSEERRNLSTTYAPWLAEGENSRQTLSSSLDLTGHLTGRLNLVGSIRQISFDQTGFLDSLNRGWENRSSRARGGVRYYASSSLTFAGGLQYETRQLDQTGMLTPGDVVLTDYPTTTTGAGMYASSNWKPRKRAKLMADIQLRRYDNPFTASSPTDNIRFRIRSRWQAKRRWSSRGGYSRNLFDNRQSDWHSIIHQFTLGVNYKRRKIDSSIQIGYLDIDRSIAPILTAPLPDGSNLPAYPQLRHLAQFRSSVLSSTFQLRWIPSKRLTVETTLRSQQNLGDSNSWPISQVEAEGAAHIRISSNFLIKMNLRYVAYQELADHYNDYRGTIAEGSLVYRW